VDFGPRFHLDHVKSVSSTMSTSRLAGERLRVGIEKGKNKKKKTHHWGRGGEIGKGG